MVKASNRLAGKSRVRYKFIDTLKHGKTMEVNDKAPEFTLANEEGSAISLKDHRGKHVVLFFYPKANTPG
jgi:peroxiredoxin